MFFDLEESMALAEGSDCLSESVLMCNAYGTVHYNIY